MSKHFQLVFEFQDKHQQVTPANKFQWLQQAISRMAPSTEKKDSSKLEKYGKMFYISSFCFQYRVRSQNARSHQWSNLFCDLCDNDVKKHHWRHSGILFTTFEQSPYALPQPEPDFAYSLLPCFNPPTQQLPISKTQFHISRSLFNIQNKPTCWTIIIGISQGLGISKNVL